MISKLSKPCCPLPNLGPPINHRYLNPTQFSALDAALSAEYSVYLPLLRTLKQRVLESVRYEPTMGARVLEVQVNLCRMTAACAAREMAVAGATRLSEIPDRLYLEVVLHEATEKLSIYKDRQARKLCSTVLTEICTEIKADMQHVLHVSDYLDNP